MWPDEARVLALMSAGFTHSEALDLTPLESKIYLGISAAWAVPPGDRVGGVEPATAAQARALLTGG
ncbi:hypothetical protein [Collinsella vaginalis]|uniref:hypothetical protein n=1 Tax=Collinsella vaginalis TaxID=1870987 RepID=UPI000A26CB7F|nr:hypothetical protein [Collinsella vaginalis]